MGGNLEGVRSASFAYFGKEPRHLSVAEAALLVALPVLLFLLLRATDWDEVFRLLREYKFSTLALGMLIALASYGIFSSFDVLSRYYIGHPLPEIGRAHV